MSPRRSSGLKPEQVKIHSQFMGGGFGRRGSVDYVAEAVEIAKAVKVPVKLTWSREDDMQHDLYRPAAMVKFTASLDASGMPAAMEVKVATPPFGFDANGLPGTAVAGLEDIEYKIPNLLVAYQGGEAGIPVTYWRAPGAAQNTFFMESFIDELAHAAKKDPLEYRRTMLQEFAAPAGCAEPGRGESQLGQGVPRAASRASDSSTTSAATPR